MLRKRKDEGIELRAELKTEETPLRLVDVENAEAKDDASELRRDDVTPKSCIPDFLL